MKLNELLAQIDIPKALLIGIFLAGFYYLLMYDDGSKWENQAKQMNNQISQKTTELKKVDKAIRDSERFKETVKELGDSFNAILKYIPKEYSTFDLMKILSTEAKAAGLNIASLSEGRGEATKYEYLEKVSANVRLEGTFSQIMLLMSYLTKVDKLMTIESMKLKVKSGAEAESPVLTFDGVFSGYRYVGEAEQKGNKRGRR